MNEACVRNETCLISGSAIRFEGQLAVFGPDFKTSACYNCLYGEADESLDDCRGNGVLGPVPSVIGNLMAVEGLKQLAGLRVLGNKLLLYDAMASEWQSLQIRKNPNCKTCGLM